MKCKKSTLRSWMIVIFIIFMEEFLYLLDTSKISISGVINYDDFWLILLIIYFGCNYLLKVYKLKTRFRFKFITLFTIVLGLISSYMAYFTMQQPFIIGLRTQRWFIFIFLMYFPIRKMMKHNMLDYNQIIDFIIKLGVIESILYILQVLLYDKFIFIHANNNIAYNEIRFYTDSAEIIFMMIFSMQKYLKSNKIKYVVFILLGLAYELIVAKGRLECISVIISLAIMIWISKGNYSKKLWIVISIIVIFLLGNDIAFITRTMDTITSILTGSYSLKTDTMIVRHLARNIFIKNMTNEGFFAMILGCGYANINYTNSANYIGGYLLVDNGIFAFIFSYGLMGVIWLGMWTTKMFKLAIRIFNKEKDFSFLAFLLFNVMIAYNIIFWWWKQDWTFILIIIMCIMEQKNDEINTNKNI